LQNWNHVETCGYYLKSAVGKAVVGDGLLRITVWYGTECSKSHAAHGLLGICVSWTPHSKEIVASTIPGLKPPDFFLWGHLKDTVYSNHPHTHTHTYTHTHTARASGQHSAHLDRISTGTLSANMIRRVYLCEECNGGHFQHLL
jgi:hypothetical protein